MKPVPTMAVLIFCMPGLLPQNTLQPAHISPRFTCGRSLLVCTHRGDLMLVRIRFSAQSKDDVPRFRNEALAIAALLTPSALIAFTIFFWDISSDLRWTTNFFVLSGPFSHWQVWLASAAALLLFARLLNRYAQPNESSDLGKEY
jgi:hypothetical protein